MYKLGNTDIDITPIGLGVMQFTGGRMGKMMFDDIDQDRMNSIIRLAYKGGINWFDTAEMYGRGHSERGLANALQSADIPADDIKIATKWFPIMRSAGSMYKNVDTRLLFLKPYHIDLFQVHNPMSFSTPEAEMNVMADLVESGKIRSVGVSNFSAEYMRRAHIALQKRGLCLASNQVQYNLLNRKIETSGVLETAKELGISIIAWSPLASGLLSGKFHNDPGLLQMTPAGRRILLKRKINSSRGVIAMLENIATSHGVTEAQVALNWLINSHGETVVAIPGASKIQHAEEAAGVMNFKLSDGDIENLNKVSDRFRYSS